MLSCAQKEEKPNVIYILADDLGYGDVSAFGQKNFMTPNIDRLAIEGMKLTRHYAGNTVCAPSRCTLMTGLHNGHARIRGNDRVPLEDSDFTIAELMKNAGYKTALIGKWGLGEPGSSGIPNKQGFDYFYGYLNQVHAHNHYPDFLWENESVDSLENKVVEHQTNYGGRGGISTNKVQYSNDLFTEKALDFIRQNKENPFFLYLPLVVPHANNEASHFGESGMEVPDYSMFANKDWPENQKRHAAMIYALDQTVGKIMQALKDQGISENTLVIFTSDNGPHSEGGADPEYFASSGMFRGQKRDMYDGGIRVPTIAHWPAKIKPGSTSFHLSGFVDMMPTLAEITGQELETPTDGHSIYPVFLGQKIPDPEFMYWEFYEQGGKQAVVFGEWKCIRLHVHDPEKTTIELYNLADDIRELTNVAEDNPEIVKKALQMIESQHTKSENFKFKWE